MVALPPRDQSCRAPDGGQHLGPRWHAIALAVPAIPQCWLGGKRYEWQRGSVETTS
ncbi:MAG TPA: hypothetical protein VMJ70_14180 [Candidatus Sulfotelmatobacter sp.]|nr:hypothetical protein [Candidatus Sulfotelmatobacter sp.]